MTKIAFSALPDAAASTFGWQEKVVLAGLLLLHLAAVCCLIPPSTILRREPMLGADQPVHAYNLHMYREAWRETGWGWGADPAVGGGRWMLPLTDIGGAVRAVTGLCLPSVTSGQIVRMFAFLAALTFPLGQWMTMRWLRLPSAACVWSVMIMLSFGWLYPTFEGFFRWGQSAFAAASYLSPFVLLLFLRFLERSTIVTYVASLLGMSGIFLLHVLSPVVILPSLAVFAIFSRPMSWKWRVAGLLLPVFIAAINSFWFIPFLLALKAPSPPGRPFDWMPPDLLYQKWSDLVAVLSPLRLIVLLGGVGLATFGFAVLSRWTGWRVATAFGMAAFFGLFLKLFGSFLPGTYLMQPSRFILPAFVIFTIPAGLAAYTICARIRLPQMLLVALAAAIPVGVTLLPANESSGGYTHVNYAGVTEQAGGRFALKLPGPIPQPTLLEPLLAFVEQRTEPDMRILIQTALQAEPLVLPLMSGREVIGNTYPDRYDSPQFLLNQLFGRKLDDWSHEELQEALQRWGVSWVFTCNEPATRLLRAATGKPGESVGVYHAFELENPPSRFLVGQGQVRAFVNRIELTDLESDEGLLVLRYRFHPAWKCTNGTPLFQYPVPEDPCGFIAMRDPPRDVRLRFDPWTMLRAEWPADGRGKGQR